MTTILSPRLDTVIRTHVKNTQRLVTLERMIRSWYDKQLYDLGRLIIINDGSPLTEEVQKLCTNYQTTYFLADGTPDTKNGLANSLSPLIASYPRLCCVDDAVFGKGIKQRLHMLLTEELPQIGDWGIVGTFACYEEGTRKANRVFGTSLWEVPNHILYALVGHIFNVSFSNIITKRWKEIKTEEAPYPKMCDDIWVKNLLAEFNFKAYNTMQDYMQHTGMDNRTFGESGDNSAYQTRMFVGE